ncbi:MULTISPECIES: DUF7115 domain-containing protein [Haloferax]|uniref:Uncharacterized protein n=1 Tax=Haloferax sp. Atlit-48N TaxID=2077198 RepID=A0ACD5HTB8_9EURY|nr:MULTISPECIES: hypothetical protein [Haloferax]MBC9987203.1 hypothetical protein [Haloferax sp. AS1]RDZ31543.1 hypothetical protein DEQ67_09155 [Haloferax sp. Atlit-48N]RDZ34854.1 hypothetical protein C5B88_10485 [Haloferax sp. Atlit-24N]RDZ36466.1 hypothetical protein C5B89_16190 [Haloferax sp. Atlit-47N]RLM35265.1 hypothetical protein DVK03_10495 [Haloferax sp. Atlit-109R]
MSQPEIVQSVLGEEDVVTRVHLGGEDELFVTPTRTLVYRAEGLLSDESVDEFSHAAEQLSVKEGRRKAKISLDYGLDGSETFSLSAKRLDDALQPIVEGVLSAAGVTDEDGERLVQAFRFSELTFVITDARVVRHIGSAVWDEDYEAYRFADVTDLEFESGSVATTVVLTVDGRQERFKIPNEQARLVREKLARALCDYHGVGSLEEFRVQMEQAQAAAEGADTERDNTDFGAGPDPLSANPGELSDEPANATRSEDAAPAEPTQQAARNQSTGSAEAAAATGAVAEAKAAEAATTQSAAESPAAEQSSGNVAGADDLGFEGSGFESAAESEAGDTATADADYAALAAEVESLREVVEAQSEQIRHQQELVEQLIEELRRGR